MKKQVVIIGAGGHGKVIADIVRSCGDQVLGFLDDDTQLPEQICGIPYLGPVSRYTAYPQAEFIIAIGSAAIRRRIARTLTGVAWYTALHPTAVVSGLDTAVGEGTVIGPNAVVNAGASIGRHCIINSGAIVEHDNVIEDYVHISVGAKLGGTVQVGEAAWIGIGGTVSNNLSICPGALVGAGGVVVKNIEEPGTYVGVPVRKIK